MIKKNKVMQQYYKDIKTVFPVHGKTENKYLQKLREQLIEFSEEVAEPTYETYLAEFGAPTDIASAYYQQAGSDYILKNLKKRDLIKKIFVVVLGTTLVWGIWQWYSYSQAYEYFKETMPSYFEDEIIEENMEIE